MYIRIICTYMYISIYMYIYVYIYICIHVYIYVHIYMYTFLYIHIHACIHTNQYVHIHTQYIMRLFLHRYVQAVVHDWDNSLFLHLEHFHCHLEALLIVLSFAFHFENGTREHIEFDGVRHFCLACAACAKHLNKSQNFLCGMSLSHEVLLLCEFVWIRPQKPRMQAAVAE